MKLQDKVAIDAESIARLSERLQEPAWLLDWRLAEYDKLLSTDLAYSKTIESSIHPFMEELTSSDENFMPSIENSDGVKLAIPLPKHNFILQYNGCTQTIHLEQKYARQGVVFTDLQTALTTHGELLKEYWLQDQAPSNLLKAHHNCLINAGVFLYVPRDVEVTVPLVYCSGLFGEHTALFPHVIIVAEENSKVHFTMMSVAGDSSLSETVVTQKSMLQSNRIRAYVGAGAKVSIATVNNLPSSVIDYTDRHAELAADSSLIWAINDFSTGKVISQTNTKLQGAGSDLLTQHVAVGTGDSLANLTHTAEHAAVHTTSGVNARIVVANKATSILNVITQINKGACKSNGQQHGKVLILHPTARGDANPILCIDENDVQAGHAASIGSIDEQQLYYLMSRGISRADAEKMLVAAFLEAVTANIKDEFVRANIANILEGKLKI